MLFSPGSTRGNNFVSKGIAVGQGAMKIYGIAKGMYGAFQVAAPYLQLAAAGVGL
jgi:hypothetical protein